MNVLGIKQGSDADPFTFRAESMAGGTSSRGGVIDLQKSAEFCLGMAIACSNEVTVDPLIEHPAAFNMGVRCVEVMSSRFSPDPKSDTANAVNAHLISREKYFRIVKGDDWCWEDEFPKPVDEGLGANG